MGESDTVCWQCKESIAVSAQKCPHCGVRRHSKGDLIAINIFAAIFVLLFAAIVAVFSPFFGAVMGLFAVFFTVYITRRKLKAEHYRSAA